MMDTVTYPHGDVVEFLQSRMIAVRLNIETNPHNSIYQISSAPTILVLETNGSEQHRIVGFSEPEDFLAGLSLGIAKLNLNHNRFDLVQSELDKIILDYPNSQAEPEVIYIKGLAQYGQDKNWSHLEEAFQELSNRFPNSYWTKKAKERISTEINKEL